MPDSYLCYKHIVKHSSEMWDFVFPLQQLLISRDDKNKYHRMLACCNFSEIN